ncbi:helix-turn-helix transcriptional regulator [Egbenema bharatensis]|uniref:helix-turn-helix transcriptional regulator n=1 Tax=Egbenema bharatensis TaxID=3463334 RepID=UPI003A86A80B
MTKPITLHPYADRPSFERLLLLIATLLNHPGIGSREKQEPRTQDALIAVQTAMQTTAIELGMALPQYSVHTLRKDLATLRQYGLLHSGRHDWGYYLGTGVMSVKELQVALQALAAQAKQGDPFVRQVYARLEQRLRGRNLDTQGQLFYPVRTQLSRSIVPTDPDEMQHRGQQRNTLFHQLYALEEAIVQGQAIEIYRTRNPYQPEAVGYLQVYPLQFIYSDIAWYLLYEYASNQHLEIERIDRFSNYLKPIAASARGINTQREQLNIAHHLLKDGWGLYLGEIEEQQRELASELSLTQVTVRFFEPVITFIVEGEYRHPRQIIHKGSKGGIRYIDYTILLPPRSIDEFSRWVYRFMHHAKVLAPQSLAEQHQEAAYKLLQLYE